MTQKNEGFTPGPWKRGGYNEYLGYDCMTGGIRVGPIVLDARDYGQGQSWDGKPWDRTRMEADADLIAKAPTLYAENERLREALEDIARGPCGCDDPEEVPSGESPLVCVVCVARAALNEGGGE